jgi:hypothetical protein
MKAGLIYNRRFISFFQQRFPGIRWLWGRRNFERNLAIVRATDADNVLRNPDVKRFHVEHAMKLTLRKNGIELPPSFMTVASDFKPKYPPQSKEKKNWPRAVRRRKGRRFYERISRTSDGYASVVSELFAGAVWRVLLVVLGAVSYYASVRVVGVGLVRYVGVRREQQRRLRKLTILPYASAILLLSTADFWIH